MKIRRIFMIAEAIIIALVSQLLWYFILPALSIHSIAMWICTLIIIGLLTIAMHWNSNTLYDALLYNNLDENAKNKIEKKAKFDLKLGRILLYAIFFGVLALIVLVLNSCTVFHTEEYRNIAVVQQGNFEEDFPEADPTGNNIPFVSMEIAQQLGDRTIAHVEGAEFYEVDDEYNLIKYQGDYYRISSLSYGGLFKYFSASSNGIPGYVLVNARTQKAEFCKVDGGYFYSPSSHFDKNLKRQLRKQYPTTIFDYKSYFEIDEQGNPYWITPTISKTIGLFGGDKVKNIIITDAVNGNSEMYDVEHLPEWVDHAILLSYLKDKATDYYELVHGAFNFSDKDVKKISMGYNSFVNKNGEVCFTMGLTPANAAKSNIGFILINPRTGEIKEYQVDGIQEETAQSRVETLVQNYGYRATFPQVVNIDGYPTYLMCLTGEDGLIQSVALACIQTSSNATAYAPSLEEAISKYKIALENSGAVITEDTTDTTIEGNIQNIYNADIEGTTYFFYVLEDNPNLYKASISLNERQVLATVGTHITITYKNEGDVINATNIELSI